ncbi:MAG: AAA family ATPase [Candidatus Aminicenantes bacterium]|nr:AAA family ATPase [Candidatus Aminicenantes bacterium]
MNPINFKNYFGFLTEPFTKEIKAATLFISARLTTLNQRLNHHLARRGIALITGDVGSGKTTAVRAFVDTLDKTHYDIVYIEDPTIGMRGIWHSIAEQLHLNGRYFKWQLMPALKNAIEKNFAEYRKTTVIIIDDAQLLMPAALDELRLFTNFRIDSASPMTVILLAQPEFRKLIQLKSLEAFNQRITLRSHLTGLAQDEVKPYIKHQLEIAGRTDELFTDDVIAEIYHQARGLPRLINNLCYQCLWEIYLQGKNIVDLPTIEKVLCNYEMA